jgi:hypothetical protein
MAAGAEITVKMTKMQALALVKVADMGIGVVKALALIQSTAADEQAMRNVKEAAALAERRGLAPRMKHQIFPRLSHSPPRMAKLVGR